MVRCSRLAQYQEVKLPARLGRDPTYSTLAGDLQAQWITPNPCVYGSTDWDNGIDANIYHKKEDIEQLRALASFPKNLGFHNAPYNFLHLKPLGI